MIFSRSIFCLTTALFFFSLTSVQAGQASPASDDVEIKRRILKTNLLAAGGITLWGIYNWDYFQNTPIVEKEEWFGRNSKEGGADKLGHFYSTYLFAHGFSGLFESWGLDRDSATDYGTLSSFAIMGWMELGDSFSSFGFSPEDMLMNTAGAAFAWLHRRSPTLEKLVDVRLEYIPTFEKADILTDYEGMKHLIALKGSGFDALEGTLGEYMELQAGYYSRGYGTDDPNDRLRREVYVGIGVNLGRVFEKFDWQRTATVFRYYQLPFTYLPFERDLNR